MQTRIRYVFGGNTNKFVVYGVEGRSIADDPDSMAGSILANF